MNYGLDSYNTTGYTTTTSANDIGAMFAGLGIAMIFIWILVLAAAIVEIVALYKMFKKAGKKGYEALIPGHDTFVLFELAGINTVWVLGIVFGSLVMIIPILGYIAFVAFMIFISIWLNIRLAKAFGKETGFGVLMAFFPFVMYPILAFGDAKYTAPKKVVNKPSEDK